MAFPPVGHELAKEELVVVPVLVAVPLPEAPLQGEARPLQDPDRGCILRVGRRLDAVEVQLLEAVAEELLHRLRHQHLPPVLLEQVVSEFGAAVLLRVEVEADRADGLTRLLELGDYPEVCGVSRLEVGLVHPLRLGECGDVIVAAVDVCLASTE